MFKLFSLSIALLGSTLFFAQNHDHSDHLDRSNMREGENVEYCKTHKELKKLMQNPAFAAQRALDQQILSQQEIIVKQQDMNKAATVYKVPIVFHVLHNGGPENISRAQILDALFILNRDYSLQNTDANNVVGAFQGMPANIEIEFVLATIAPNGQCFSGITRTRSPRTVDTDSDNYDGGDQVDAIINGNDVYQGVWNPSKYLNVYICKEIGGAAGYTYNPSSFYTGSMTYNGIYMLHNYTGSIGTSMPFTSRALTHEVGHWLNLSHTWGPNNNPGNQASCSDDDFVNDTPNTKGVTSCNLSESSCGVLANVENYMDYSYCSKMFTEGQRTRMRAALTSSVDGRNNIWKTSNLNATGANGNPGICKADFSTENTIICTGSSVSFTDESFHNPTSWSWSFQGGSPSTSSSQNPTVTYTTPGIYSVTLTVSNYSGSVSNTKSQYIHVVSENGSPAIQEGFEFVNSIPSNDWFVENFDNGVTWELTNVTSASGNNCVMLNNAQNTTGNNDELQSTTINLDLYQSASLSFDYAFAKKNSSNHDRLIVKVSSNCGQTWLTKKSLSGITFETAPNTTGNFIPSETQWKTATISSNSLTNYLGSNFRVKFIFESDGGNNVYIDNININGPVSIQENSLLNNFSMYPNPANEQVTISFLAEEDNYKIQLLDVVGKEVKSLHNGSMGAGDQKYVLDLTNYSSGIYFVSITKGATKELHKLVVK